MKQLNKHQSSNIKQSLSETKKSRFSFFSFVLITFLSMFLFSCQEEFALFEDPANQSKISIDATVINGRFYFSTKESLGKQIEKYEKSDITITESKFERFYQNGFRSHIPLVNSENKVLLNTFAEEKAYTRSLSQKSKSQKKEKNGFISDPLFAAIINQDNEIIVGDTLYKYTAKKGLFFVHVKDSTHLFEFFKNIETGNQTNKLALVEEPCMERQLYGGVISVDEEISRYVAPIDEDGCSGGGGGGTTTPTIPTVTAEENINTIINDLPICKGNKGNFFQDLFGDSFYCRSYWTDTRRIHTEFWSKDVKIYASTGIMVKSQRKLLGIWGKSNVNELYLGINSILLKYNYKKPEIQFDPNSTYGYMNPHVPLYMYNQKFSIKTGVTSSVVTGFSDIWVSVSKNTLPFFQFDDIDVLNIYIPNIPVLGNYSLNLTGNSIYSQSNIKQLYKMGLDFLKTKSNSKKDFVITYQKTTEEIEVIYFGEQHHKNDEKIIKRYFYKDSGFKISFNAASNPAPGNYIDNYGNPYTVPKFNTKFGIEPLDDYFRNYTYYDLDFYGLGRRGTTWKGNRMIRSDNN